MSYVGGQRPQHAASKFACLALHTMPDCVLLAFVRVVSPPFGWSPLSSFSCHYGLQVVTREVPSVVFETVDVPTSFSHFDDYLLTLLLKVYT